jgi:phosphate transport system substrate-binding protein
LKKETSLWILSLTILLAVIVMLAGCRSNTQPAPSTSKPSAPPPVTSAAPPASTGAPAPLSSAPTSTTVKPSTTASNPSQASSLSGAGATFPQPLYTKWFDVYNQQFNIKINYQGIGSGGGIQQITAGTVDFGASDGIMSDDQEKAAVAAGGPILHIPMTSGSVAVVYNLQGIDSGKLKLTGDILARIYLVQIFKWNDPAIAALNPGLNLPNTPIITVHRSEGSGTTNIFTNYLSKVSDEWKTRVGTANSVNWPGGLGGQGNAGVAGAVQQTPGAIGYVELAYARQNKIAWASIKNAAGNYKEPFLEGTTAAASGIALPDNMKIMITNSTNPDAYPIVGFTWILAFVNQKDQARGLALVNMLWWAIHDGQQYASPLDYGALSGDAVKKAEVEILSIKYNGQPLKTR